MNFDEDYTPDYFTGTYIKDQLEAEGKKELILTISSIAAETFNDTKNPQWVASFGVGTAKLRIKPGIGTPLRHAFGPRSETWIGKRVALSSEPIEWEDQATHEMKSGFAIRARPLADDEPASQPSRFLDTLDDDIPFGRLD